MHDVVELVVLLSQVIFINLVLSGDNAIVVGMAAAGLHGPQRRKAIVMGIGAATVLRIVLGVFASFLLEIVGLLLAGGLLLLWVCWKMWRELRESAFSEAALQASGGGAGAVPVEKTLAQAIWQIIAADVSMSLDNVLAVAGAAHEHPIVLVFGLGLSVILMGFAASLIARILDAHRWIAYVGLFIIAFVAVEMIYQGGLATAAAMGFWAGGPPAPG